MALRFVDGFDHVDVNALLLKWSSGNNLSYTAIEGGTRFGVGSCFRVGLSGSLTVDFGTNQPTWIVGFAYKNTGNNNTYIVAALLDSGAYQCELRIDTTGRFLVTRNGTTLATSTLTYPRNGVWRYVEFKATIGNAGAYEVRVDGETWLAATGVDTQNTANAWANRMQLCDSSAGTNGFNGSIDDLYVCDATGSANNDFLGDSRVYTLLPSSAGTYTQWAPTGAAANWDAVNDAAPDGDTSYVAASTVGALDTYQYPDLPGGTVYGVAVNLDLRKDDAGTRQVASYVKSGSTEQAGASIAVPSSWDIVQQIWQTDPATGGAWTASAVNAAEFGVKVTG